jgi:hypothetical protein
MPNPYSPFHPFICTQNHLIIHLTLPTFNTSLFAGQGASWPSLHAGFETTLTIVRLDVKINQRPLTLSQTQRDKKGGTLAESHADEDLEDMFRCWRSITVPSINNFMTAFLT